MKITLRSYIVGFILSVLLTLAAFLAAVAPARLGLGARAVIPVIVVLALVQLFVQLACFMHLGSGERRADLATLLSTMGIILIIVIGSFWIMDHLNYNMMASPQQMSAYIQSQDGL